MTTSAAASSIAKSVGVLCSQLDTPADPDVRRSLFAAGNAQLAQLRALITYAKSSGDYPTATVLRESAARLLVRLQPHVIDNCP